MLGHMRRRYVIEPTTLGMDASHDAAEFLSEPERQGIVSPVLVRESGILPKDEGSPAGIPRILPSYPASQRRRKMIE